jgi:NADH-quinone oxidoreductase subunit N
VGKFYILRASVESGYVGLAVILAVTTLVSYYYYLRVIVTMYMRPEVEPTGRLDWGAPVRAALVVCAAVTILLGILPSWPLLKARESVEQLRPVAELSVDQGQLAGR